MKVGLDALKAAADPIAKAVVVPLHSTVDKPGAIALGAAGTTLITDLGGNLQVKTFAPDGRPLGRLGNTGYAGQGSFTHDSDPTKGVAELNEIRLDPAARTWSVESIMYNPGPAKGDFRNVRSFRR